MLRASRRENSWNETQRLLRFISHHRAFEELLSSLNALHARQQHERVEKDRSQLGGELPVAW